MNNVKLELLFPHQYDIDMEVELASSEGTTQCYYPSGQHTRTGDGLLVKVIPYAGSSWIGIFAPGYPNALTGIYSSPHEQKVCVVSSGQAYIVRVDDPHAWEEVRAFPVWDVRAIPDKQILILADFTTLTAYDREGMIWKTDHLSWDGLKITSIGNDGIRGLAWSAPLSKDVEFVVDLETGQHKGGSSPPEIL